MASVCESCRDQYCEYPVEQVIRPELEIGVEVPKWPSLDLRKPYLHDIDYYDLARSQSFDLGGLTSFLFAFGLLPEVLQTLDHFRIHLVQSGNAKKPHRHDDLTFQDYRFMLPR